MLKREWDAESFGKLPHLFIPSKTAALVPEFAVEDLPSAELQPMFLRLYGRTYPWAEHSDNDDETLKNLFNFLKNYHGQNNLFIVKSIIRIIIHFLEISTEKL